MEEEVNEYLGLCKVLLNGYIRISYDDGTKPIKMY